MLTWLTPMDEMKSNFKKNPMLSLNVKGTNLVMEKLQETSYQKVSVLGSFGDEENFQFFN